MGHVPRSWLGCSVPSHSFNARHLFPKTYTKSGLGGILQTQRQETRNSLISWLPSPIRTPREDSSWSKSEVRSLSRSKNSTRTTSAMLAPREALAKTRTVKSVDFAPTKAWNNKTGQCAKQLQGIQKSSQQDHLRRRGYDSCRSLASCLLHHHHHVKKWFI